MSFRDRVVELRRVRAGDLIPHEKNWRTHPESQRSALTAMLDEIGFAGAIVARVDEGGGVVVIDGHLRSEMDPDAEVPVLITDLDEAEADRLLVTYDPIGDMAGTDPGRLVALLDDIGPRDGAIGDLLGSLRSGREVVSFLANKNPKDPDDVGDPPEDPRTRPGDLWQLGRHRLLCGSSTNPDDVERLMGGEKADLMWTDPPYGVDYQGKTKRGLTIASDSREDLSLVLMAAWRAVGAHLVPGAPFYVMAPQGPGLGTVMECLKLVGWHLHQGLVWVKDVFVLGHADYHYRHENILYGWLPGPGRSGRGAHGGTKWYGDNASTSVFDVARPRKSEEHPTIKPVELVETMVANSCPVGGRVIDPFAGSGTTIIAAERQQRIGYAMELEPAYADVVVARWEEFTGEEAVLL